MFRRALERMEDSAPAVIALKYFHRLVDGLQARGAAASIGVMLAHQLAIALLDALQAEGLVVVMKAEQFKGSLLFFTSLHPRPEACQ